MFGEAKGWVLGIDLGTTNTSAVAFGPDRPGPVSIVHGRSQPVMPSVVSLKNPSLPLVGWLARDMMLTDPLTTVYGWKRFIGLHERSEFVSRYRDRFPFRIHASPNEEIGAVVDGTVYPFVQIASLVLDQMRLQASAVLHTAVRDCVIAVPAHFANAQRDDVREAGKRAGLNVLKLVNEPTAAAIAFGLNQSLDSRVLIFDLGGGTFDATVLEVVDNIFDVKATRGHGFLGGADFDRAVMERLVEICKEDRGVDLSEEPIVAQRVLNAAENGKCVLSTENQVRIHVPMIGHDRKGKQFDLDYMLTREELEGLTAPLVERTIGIVEEMLKSASLKPEEIDNVIVVGGQSRMPLVSKRIEEVFEKAPLGHLDPNTSIAEGAAIVAKEEEEVGGAVLLDVLSVPIGIVFPGGKTEVIFEANTSLPAQARISLDGYPVGERGLSLGVWQGSDITSPERHVLGVIRMPQYLFLGGTEFAIELTLKENLNLRTLFQSSVQTVPLLLEG